MKRHALTIALSASVLALSAAPALADFTLNILHINDWHSRIESINKYDSTCGQKDEADGKCFGGAARLVAAAAAERKALGADSVLFLSAGDNFQGSLFYSTYKGTVEAEFLNRMGLDVMTIGNHEFDDGEPGLVSFLGAVKFPVVSANVLPGYKSGLAGKIPPSVIVERGGQKIGVVGAVANDTDELSSPGDGVLIAQDVASIKAAVDALVAQGIDKIIALTHVGYPRDLAVIARIPGVDVVVGGHSHTYLANGDEKAAGPYPTLVDNPDGHKVPVVQAGSYSRYLGRLAVTFDDKGVVTQAKGDPLLLDASVTPDADVLARIAELGAPIEALKKKEVGTSAGPIDAARDACRTGECAMGNLVADAMLARVKNQGVTIAIQNGGGLRSSIDGGTVTMGEVLTVLPFQNTVATFRIKGAGLLAALENGASQIEEGAGRFAQVAGMKYAFDVTKPAGARISGVMVAEGDAYVPLDPDKLYSVATNNYVRAGGDGYKMFVTDAQDAYDYGPNVEDVVADYIRDNSPYQPLNASGRITRIAAEAAAAPAPEPAKPAEAKVEMKAELSPPSATAGSHTIVSGDNFWNLAKTYYGDAQKWKTIATANPGAAAKGLVVGSQLVIPPAN
ncbi:MAG: 5'-nucleotidase C-terminal domain-containing protein [Brucellaceae bacterium]|nr:5'-nucleotidase C-terminal domain-containing protein [Brucellaceae bacterium]